MIRAADVDNHDGCRSGRDGTAERLDIEGKGAGFAVGEPWNATCVNDRARRRVEGVGGHDDLTALDTDGAQDDLEGARPAVDRDGVLGPADLCEVCFEGLPMLPQG